MAAAASSMPVRRALISVSDKTGVESLARALADHGVEVLSTGGTARLLRDAGVPVIEVGDYTGFPEIMAGRVKTLHPRIHGGLLGRRGEDEAVMAEQDIPPIDLLVVNLYPFEQTVARPDCRLAEAIENIDIGGPAMLRAAAKNHAGVGVVTDPAQYDRVLASVAANGGLDDGQRFELAVAAFDHVARYDAAISNYLSARTPAGESTGFSCRDGSSVRSALTGCGWSSITSARRKRVNATGPPSSSTCSRTRTGLMKMLVDGCIPTRCVFSTAKTRRWPMSSGRHRIWRTIWMRHHGSIFAISEPCSTLPVSLMS